MNLILLLIATIPHTPVIEDHFDQIEINHSYDSGGRLLFDQFLFWKGDHIHAWRMIKPSRRKPTDEENLAYEKEFAAQLRTESQRHRQAYRNRYNEKPKLVPHDRPVPDDIPPYVPPYEGQAPTYRHGRWVLIIHDDGVIRRITAPSKRETWTQFDPEVEQRKTFKIDKRPDLTKHYK